MSDDKQIDEAFDALEDMEAGILAAYNNENFAAIRRALEQQRVTIPTLTTRPDCMKPDGAGPCAGYKSLQASITPTVEQRVPEGHILIPRVWLKQTEIIMRQAQAFTRSREKMHQEGQDIYDECLEALQAHLLTAAPDDPIG